MFDAKKMELEFQKENKWQGCYHQEPSWTILQTQLAADSHQVMNAIL